MRRLAAAVLPLLLAANPAAALDGGRYGEVRLSVPAGGMQGFVIYFSDRGGWTDADQAAIDDLARDGALAVGVDTDRYLARLQPGTATCDQLVGDAEGLSRQLQRQHSGAAYEFPILAGIGAGGALADAVMAQAPVNTLAGVVAVDPDAAIHGPRPLCPPAADHLFGFSFTGHARSRRAAATELARLMAPLLVPPKAEGMASLPLLELPSEQPSPLLAIVLSGDGGWRDLDKTIAEALRHDGVSVVGWDSLRYFWSKKTPERTASDLAAVIGFYSRAWHADRVALVGYSFGADVLPFAYDLLPREDRDRVVLMALLGVEDKADWEISVSGWLGAPPTADAIPIAPAIAAMPAALIQCFYGEDEHDSFCPSLAGSGAEIVRTTGGHHFDGDYAALERRILARLRPPAGP
jgi:type IV secretory pathway VirJ component